MTRDATSRNFAQLCATLAELTPAQLEQVRVRATFLAEGARSPTGPQVPRGEDHDWLLRGIEAELRRRGLTGTGQLPATRLRPDWDVASARVRRDLLAAHGRGGDRQVAALGQLAARALADWLAGARVRIGPKTMLQNADKILLAIDDAFPGYVEAGLLRCCLDPELVGDRR